MSNTARALRQLIREEIEDMMKEYRPNTFMLSQMEEQDRDGDGDEDFDDVRVARYTKGGMSKDQALAKVKKNPMGDGGKKQRRKE